MGNNGKIDSQDAGRIRNDAWEAIDALQAIMKEAGSTFCFAPYILEKAEKAQWCINFITETAKEYAQEGTK